MGKILSMGEALPKELRIQRILLRCIYLVDTLWIEGQL